MSLSVKEALILKFDPGISPALSPICIAEGAR